MTAEQVKLDVPWFVLALTAVGVLGSAVVATAAIGPGHTDLQLPAVLTYAIPVVIHATSRSTAPGCAHGRPTRGCGRPPGRC